MTNEELKKRAQSVLQEEADAIMRMKDFIGDDFVRSLEVILNSKGRLVVTGIGKSAIIGQKMVATFNSTGTPAIFMHAADAIHGDLGIIQPDDVVLCISKSGNTPEISVLVPYLKKNGNPLIAVAGNPDSFLAKEANYFIDCSVEKEACPNNLAPTSSSTAQLVIGDALASCLIEMRGFTSQDFARYHPGGILGKRLYLKVADLYKMNAKPSVDADASIPNVIFEISGKMLGVTAVIENGELLGVVTDGDLRRMLQKTPSYDHLSAKDIMTPSPKTVSEETLAVEALDKMKKANITNLVVTDENGRYSGIIHMHDILKEGIY